MDTSSHSGPERSVSGRKLVVVALVAILLVTAFSVLFGPALRDQVRNEQRPRTLRDPVASGTYQGETWEAVGHFDGTANCVELRYDGEMLDRACDTHAQPVTATPLPSGGPTVAYGIAPEDAQMYDVQLDNGEQISVPVTAGDLGFPVGFWAVQLPEGVGLSE